MIELSGSDYIGGPSSRGNQMKFKRDGYWYILIMEAVSCRIRHLIIR